MEEKVKRNFIFFVFGILLYSLFFQKYIIFASFQDTISIAVIPLENLNNSSELESLREGIADALRIGLEDKEDIKVVERMQLEKILEEQKLGLSGLIDSKSAVEVGKLLGAKYLLTGSFFVLNETIRIIIKFVDVETGQIDLKKIIILDGKKENVFEMTNILIDRIDENLKKESIKIDESIKSIRIAIIPFKNNTKKSEYDGIGTFTAEVLQNSLSSQDKISVVERAQINKVLTELKLGTTGFVDEVTAAKIGKLHGANYLLLGSYSILGDKIQITAKFVETETGVVGKIKSQQVIGELKELFTLEDKLAEKIKESLKE